MKDEDYTTPHDHYFGYINQRQAETPKDEEAKHLDVIRGLGLEHLLPPTYNLETITPQKPKPAPQLPANVNLDEVDVFELAKMRGTNVYGLRELMNERD